MTDFERTLIELPPNTWFEVPDSHMREVCVPESAEVSGVGGCAAIIDAWSGGAYDSARRRMVIWGGGHEDYWGNELYGFDLREGMWAQLTEPSVVDPSAHSQDPLEDGKPVSRHTYDGVQYIQHLDRLWGHGGSRARDGGATPRTWIFDAETSSWTMHSDGPGDFTLAAAYDPNGQRVFTRVTQSLWTYAPDGDEWTLLQGFGFAPEWPRYERWGDKTGTFDTQRDLFWSVGSGDVLVWDAVAGELVTDQWVTTGGGDYTNEDWVGVRSDQLFVSGGGDVYNAPAPGFEYDFAADALVGWPNQGAPRILDLETKTWSIGDAEGAPASRTSGGTFGRFRFVAAYNVFVLVTSVDENVYFYKHTSGCGTP